MRANVHSGSREGYTVRPPQAERGLPGAHAVLSSVGPERLFCISICSRSHLPVPYSPALLSAQYHAAPGLSGTKDLQEAFDELMDSQLPPELVAAAAEQEQMPVGQAKTLAKQLHRALKAIRPEIDTALTAMQPDPLSQERGGSTDKAAGGEAGAADAAVDRHTAERLKRLMPVVEEATAEVTARHGE